MSGWTDIAAQDVPLAPLTTYKLGGAARYFVTVDDEAELDRVAALIAEEPIQVVVLGRGSNVLVSDRGFDGVVLQLGRRFSWVTVDEHVLAGGAAPLPVLARTAAKAGRGGLEFFVGIPGSVGGALMMNAGCFGRETSDVLIAARVVDLETSSVRFADASSLDLGYRHSNLGPFDIVTRAEFRTEPEDPVASERLIREIIRSRKATQPGGILNAGSVFKNPPGDSAGRLIDRAGLKGLSVGGARVSHVHANFIEAGRGAMASDVYRLIRLIQSRMVDQGVHLEPEVRFVGEF